MTATPICKAVGANGLPNQVAVVRAMETAGRSVIYSGCTVAIGLLALVVLPLPFLRSMGYGGVLIPLVIVAVILTLSPVLLATVGPIGRLAADPAGLGRPGPARWSAIPGLPRVAVL